MNKIELTSQDVEILLKEHKYFFNTQETKDIDFRIEQLKKLKCGIKKYESKILEALKKDLRKNEIESYITEIGFVYKSIEDTIKSVKKWTKPKRVKTPIFLMPAKSFIISEPYGTVLIIGPYNYPFQLVIEPLIGVIAAGNCAVIKPSEVSPNVSKVITELIKDTFEKRYVSCVEGAIETNTALINSKFDYIFFTGSVGVGKVIMEAAAKNLIPVTLELGGKSPVIVDESSDIKVAAKKIIWGKTLNSGQTCVAPDYVVVHESIKDDLIKEMEVSIKEFFGTNTQESESLGRIINDRHYNRLKTIIDKDREHIIYGGKYDEREKYIEPTIIEVSSWDAASMREEIFGPILPVMSYRNLDKVINDIQKQPKPLALYLFTTNKSVENKVLSQISSGGVCINETITHLANTNLPFGGVGSSGMGSYHGEQSFITFSHKKSVLKKGNRFNINMLFPPYNERQLNIIKKFFK